MRDFDDDAGNGEAPGREKITYRGGLGRRAVRTDRRRFGQLCRVVLLSEISPALQDGALARTLTRDLEEGCDASCFFRVSRGFWLPACRLPAKKFCFRTSPN